MLHDRLDGRGGLVAQQPIDLAKQLAARRVGAEKPPGDSQYDQKGRRQRKGAVERNARGHHGAPVRAEPLTHANGQ
jgi:hypothetical protein